MNSIRIHRLGLAAAVLLFSMSYTQSALVAGKNPGSKQEAGKEPITLEDVLASKFSAGGFSGGWVPGSDNLIRVISSGTVLEHDMLTNISQQIVNGTVFQNHVGQRNLSSLTFSNDNNFILVEHSRTNLWRHSFVSRYDVYDVDSGTFEKLEPKLSEPSGEQVLLQLVQWSTTGSSLAFVYGNNIYYKSSPMADNSTIVQITDDGGEEYFNGISDWVYEEEMFGSPTALWFSKDSSNLAFVKFNDTKVKSFSWPVYGVPGSVNPDSRYPEYDPIKYPKSGTDNPDVSVNVVSLNNPTNVRRLDYTIDDPSQHYYIATTKWATNNELIVVTLNRAQNESHWNLCSANDASCSEFYSYSQPNGWIDAHTPIVYDDGQKLLTLEPVKQSNGHSYTHIVSVPVGSVVGSSTPITSGDYSVGSIVALDEVGQRLFFTGTGFSSGNPITSDPSEVHVYAVADNSTSNATPVCISCTQKNNAGEDCRSNSVSFSANFSFYTHNCKGPDVPETSTKKTDGNEVVRTWVDNNAVRLALNAKAIPQTLNFDVPLNIDGFIAKVRLYVPADFDRTKKYPLLIDVYAGPDSQRIGQDYKVDWGTSMTSDKGVIYGSIDGRGSAKQSTDLKFSVYRNLGSAEIEDQITVTKYLIENNSFIDASRTAIWGWSYGGYATAMTLGKDTENVFKCGISVAPVTSWLYYDTIYTERYMGLPTIADNWIGYNESSVMNHFENFKNKQFLLIHGNADDNVHYQHSMMLAKTLEENDIMFEQLSYPDENHSIGSVRPHLYHSIERFLFRECFAQTSESGTTSSSTSTTTDNADPSKGSGTVQFVSLQLIGLALYILHI